MHIAVSESNQVIKHAAAENGSLLSVQISRITFYLTPAGLCQGRLKI